MRILIFFFIFDFVLGRQVASENTNISDNARDSTWWQHAVFYQIYPRSFMDFDGDGIGDLQGITMKLPYLVDTGIDAIWLNPIFKSPMADFGYDISDFQVIHEEYGTMEDFDALMTEANLLGIKVLLDFVPNHTSDESEWFEKSIERVPGYEKFYIWADGKLNEKGERESPNNWQSVFYGSAWEWNEKREQYYLHQFTTGQPDLNYRNPVVVAAMDGVLKFWLDKGISGFRVDAVNHLFEIEDLRDEPLSGKTADKRSYDYTDHIFTKNLPEVLEMLYHWRNILDDYTTTNGGPERILLTESYAPLKLLMKYYETDSGVPGSHVPFNFNLITDLDKNSDARDFVYNIQKWLIYMPNEQHVANWVLGNHDNPRVASRFPHQLVDALNMMLLTLPGIAVTYNGEEIGMTDYRDISWEETVDPPARNVGPEKFREVSRDPERTPFQWNSTENAGFSSSPRTWLPVNPNYVNLNLEAQIRSPKSHYNVYKKLIETRAHPLLVNGKCETKVLSRYVFAIKREIFGQGVIATIINLSPQRQTVTLNEFLNYPKEVSVLIAGTNSTRENGYKISAYSISVEAFEGLVLKIHTAVVFNSDKYELIKTLVKSTNIILIGLFLYKLWNNKWSTSTFTRLQNNCNNNYNNNKYLYLRRKQF